MGVYVEEKLISQIGMGDSSAFGKLYEATSNAVYGYALSILKNSHDAEDIMQEVYIKIHACADTYQPAGKPMAWILTIVKNLCYNAIRDGKNHEDIADHMNISSGSDTESSINTMVLEEAMKVLDLEERQIVMLHSMTGMKHREIAEIVDMPISTVLSKYNRSLKKMKKAIEERGA